VKFFNSDKVRYIIIYVENRHVYINVVMYLYECVVYEITYLNELVEEDYLNREFTYI